MASNEPSRYRRSTQALEALLAGPHHLQNRLKSLDELSTSLAKVSNEEKYRLSVSRRCACVLNDAQSRGKCPFCWVGGARCYCKAVPRIAVPHRFFLLLHFREYQCISNTGRILMMALDGEVLIPGIEEHDRMLAHLCSQRNTCVLYPSTTAVSVHEFFDQLSRGTDSPAHTARKCGELEPSVREEEELFGSMFDIHPQVTQVTTDGRDCDLAHTPSNHSTTIRNLLRPAEPPVNVLIPDGTWNLVRSMVHRLPSHVPRIALQPPCGYATVFNALRKQPTESHISTMEAGILLLQEMGLDGPSCDSLTNALKHHVDVVLVCAHQEQAFGTVPTARTRQQPIAGPGPAPGAHPPDVAPLPDGM
eukprot:EG_transcript_15517